MSNSDVPFTWNVTRIRGNPWNFTLRFYTPGATVMSLDGVTVGMAFGNNQYFSGTGSFYVTESNGISFDRENGLASFSLNADDLDAFPIYNPMYFRINVQESGESEISYIVGSLTQGQNG